MPPDVRRTKSFVEDAVALILQCAEDAVQTRGVFRIALSGGNTPRPVYQALSKEKASWDKWEITFGDERCVPPTSDQSNFRMAKEALFDHIAIPPSNILRMQGELDPTQAAADYEKELLARARGGSYRHDLILLGMGDDGHTASLFPKTEALHVTDRLVVANYVPKFSTHRMTFTYPLLNAARHICFLVNSRGKEAVLEAVLSGDTSYPSAAINPNDGQLTWLIGNEV